MENPTSKVIKSKSSNSAITTKCENKRRKIERQRKKSKSSAEFQTLSVKKRGVYVENKAAKNLSARVTDTQIDEVKPKPPPRPKPGSKRFLASVLTILSKSTTGTQHPDTTDKKPKTKKKNLEAPPVDNEKKKKPKFRSKILNENKYQVDKFEVLQSKKEIIQTPSLYSERSYREDIKLSDLPRLVKPEEEVTEVKEMNTVSNLVKEVTEGRKLKEKKVKVLDPEPLTLVSEHKEDKRLYNFFVDLLETTFSVYNVKAEYSAAPVSTNSSKISLEMDESVAKKLNVATEMYDDVIRKPSKHFYCIRNENERWNDDKLIDYFQSSPSSYRRINELPLKTPAKRRKLKSESFALSRSRESQPQSKSTVMQQRKSFHRKNKKVDLLNILKEQLRMDHVSFEEPQNLFQALRVMAKNNRKQRTIRFDKTAKNNTRSPECMLKRRKVISAKKSRTQYESEYTPTGPITKRFSELRGRKRNFQYDSNHSLEVYGFDYDTPYKHPPKREKEVFIAYHSSPSNSDLEEVKSEDSGSTIRDFTFDNFDSMELD